MLLGACFQRAFFRNFFGESDVSTQEQSFVEGVVQTLVQTLVQSLSPHGK